MNAVLYDRPGEPEVLQLGECAVPTTVGYEFLVRVVAAGVNPVDAKTRAGKGWSRGLRGYPVTPGFDFSGVVVSTPYDAHPIKVGEEVFGISGFPRQGGSYAEYVSVPGLQLARKPRRLSHVEAAAAPLAALTAWGMVVEIAKAHEGQRVLVHAGAGGVGHFAVQLAAFFGAYVVATASEHNLTWLRELGAAEVVDYRHARFEEVLDPVDVVIDLLGNSVAETSSRSLQLLRPGGLIVTAPSGGWPTMAEEAKARQVRASNVIMQPDGATLGVLARLLDSGDLRVHVDEVFDLEHAAEAHRAVESGHSRGKTVLRVASA